MKLIILSLLILSGCASKQIASQKWPVHDCQTFPDVPGATYCVDETAPGATDVLFWMHGLGDAANVWTHPTSIPSNYPELIKSMPPMRIVTVSFSQPVKIGSMDFQSGWMLTNEPRILAPVNSTLETFKNKMLPYLEVKYGLKPPYKLAGHSQGGNNAAMLAVAYPELWSKAALINPALITKDHNPWDLSLGEYCPWCYMVKYNYNDITQWKKERPTPMRGMPPMLVTACPIDIFGLYSGTEAYVVASRKLDNKVTFLKGEPLCSHWTFDYKRIVGFLR